MCEHALFGIEKMSRWMFLKLIATFASEMWEKVVGSKRLKSMQHREVQNLSSNPVMVNGRHTITPSVWHLLNYFDIVFDMPSCPCLSLCWKMSLFNRLLCQAIEAKPNGEDPSGWLHCIFGTSRREGRAPNLTILLPSTVQLPNSCGNAGTDHLPGI